MLKKHNTIPENIDLIGFNRIKLQNKISYLKLSQYMIYKSPTNVYNTFPLVGQQQTPLKVSMNLYRFVDQHLKSEIALFFG